LISPRTPVRPKNYVKMPLRHRVSAFFLPIICGLFTLWAVDARGETGKWADIAAKIGKLDAVAIAAPDGKIIFSKHAHVPLIPASILKILTALVALDRLGPDYRFPTDFHIGSDQNLVIKGYGDPFLVSEHVQAICGTLSGQVDAIENIVIDASYFQEPVRVPGTSVRSLQPYDAPIGALCVNFNTVSFKKQNGRYISAEPQTPLLPLAEQLLAAISVDQGRILLSEEKTELTRYAGELFRYFLIESRMNVRGEILTGLLPPDAGQPLYRHSSALTLAQVIEYLMKYSNNFIANQIFLAAGAAAYGPPATLEKGVRAAERYAKSIGIDPVIVEGSGISRQNRVTAAMFLKILDAFAPYHELLREKGPVFYKTGTLNGIQTRAGYIRGADDQLYRFALLINTPGKLADPVVQRICDRLLQL